MLQNDIYLTLSQNFIQKRLRAYDDDMRYMCVSLTQCYQLGAVASLKSNDLMWHPNVLLNRVGLRSISSVVPKADLEIRDFKVENEPLLSYLPGSKERQELEAALKTHAAQTEECPIIIGGKEYRTDDVRYQVMVSFTNPLNNRGQIFDLKNTD